MTSNNDCNLIPTRRLEGKEEERCYLLDGNFIRNLETRVWTPALVAVTSDSILILIFLRGENFAEEKYFII